jgi:thymidylate synthase (FAD)
LKIITNPEVYLIGKQTVVDEELDLFLADHGVTWQSDSENAGEVIAETAGRVCYMSFAKPRPGGNSAYLDHIKEVGHGSVLEHAVWTFLITGVSRSLTHELVRHRAGFAFSQLSQRYVDESVAEYVCPDIIAEDMELFQIWEDAVEYAHNSYKRLAEELNAKLAHQCSQCGGRANLESFPLSCANCGGNALHGTELRKAARQAARSVLPNATETKITVTANARSIRHFLEQRGSQHAESEIRKLANAILEVVQADAPNLFGDYVKVQLPDGTFELTTPYRKV